MTDKVLCKTVQLINGVDLLGSMLSLNNKRGNELSLDAYGVKAISAKNGRVVLIPWSNIKGIELFPEVKVKPENDYANTFETGALVVSAMQAKPRGRPKGS